MLVIDLIELLLLFEQLKLQVFGLLQVTEALLYLGKEVFRHFLAKELVHLVEEFGLLLVRDLLLHLL